MNDMVAAFALRPARHDRVMGPSGNRDHHERPDHDTYNEPDSSGPARNHFDESLHNTLRDLKVAHQE